MWVEMVSLDRIRPVRCARAHPDADVHVESLDLGAPRVGRVHAAKFALESGAEIAGLSGIGRATACRLDGALHRAHAARGGYTAGMKTAVSIPDDIFERAERLARREQRSRSDVYAAALVEYVARHAHDEITDTMNRVCDEVGEHDDAFLSAAGRRVLDRVEW